MRKPSGVQCVSMAILLMAGCDNPSSSDQAITRLSIPGVVAPVRGSTPVTSPIETAQYTGTVTWTPDDAQFKEKTVYTARIELTTNPGWTLDGIGADSFTVEGATVTNSTNSGSVVAVFPATYAAPILSMVEVPAGSYQRDASSTNVSVVVSSFWISRYEITMEQFVAVTGRENPSPAFADIQDAPVQNCSWCLAIVFCNRLSMAEGLTPVYTKNGTTDPDGWGTIPTDISDAWDDVVPNWDADGYRLPTELEWMWAAMGATSDRSNGYDGVGKNTTGYLKGYAGSAEAGSAQVSLGSYAWYYSNSGTGGSSSNRKTHTVGTAGSTGHLNRPGIAGD